MLTPRARRELADAAVDRMRRRHIGEAEIGGERVVIDLGAPLGERLERLQLRGEDDAAILPSPIERLDAEPVAHQAEPALLAVEHGERKHADQPLDRRAHAPCGDPLDDDLRIRVAPEAAAERFELGPELRRAIDLAVIGEDIAAAGRRHGLRAGGRQVDDG